MMGMVTGGADRDITNMCCSRLNSRSNLQSIQMPLSSSSLICAWARVADRLRAGQGRAGQGRAGQGRAGQGRAGQGRAGSTAQRTQGLESRKVTFT